MIINELLRLTIILLGTAMIMMLGIAILLEIVPTKEEILPVAQFIVNTGII